MKKNPLFSIITVCFNSAKTIEQTIQSVLNQTYKNFEYIIIDGGSTDGTIDAVKKYQKKIDYFVSEKDDGIYDAMNKGIKVAKGKWIGIINSDDWYERNALEIVNKYLVKNSDIKIFYGILKVYKNNNFYSIQSQSHHFLREVMIPHPTCFVNKTVYENIGLYDLKYKYSADYDLFLKFYQSNVKFYFIEQCLANFSLGGMSSKRQAIIESLDIRKKYRMDTSLQSFILKTAMNIKFFLKKFIKMAEP